MMHNHSPKSTQGVTRMRKNLARFEPLKCMSRLLAGDRVVHIITDNAHGNYLEWPCQITLT